MKKIKSGTLLFIMFVGVLCSAGTISKIDQEFMKSEESGKLRKLYSRMGDLDGRGDSSILIYANQAGKEMERFANLGSNLAVCSLANFYGPQASNDRYHEKLNLSLKWLIEGQKRGLNCDINQIYTTDSMEDLSEQDFEDLSSLGYLMIVVRDNNTPAKIKQNYPYYLKGQNEGWLTKAMIEMPKESK
jgi:hypothetical protein